MRKRTLGLLTFLVILGNSPLGAYDSLTHREIGERAAQSTVSSIDRVLKDDLGIPAGIAERFEGQSVPGLRNVQELIGDGSLFEDVPGRRSFNHFHNPLVSPWDDAGLRTFSILGVPLIRGQSSVLWQQNPSQDSTFVLTPIPSLSGGGNWSWQDARRHYLNALTRTRKEDVTREGGQKEPGRDTAFAETFEALGRLTHLIQDASVPAHVRNDPHPEFSIFGTDLPLISNPDGYERHISRLRGAARNSPARNLFESLVNQPPKRPSFSIFASTGNLQAPVPVARLIDTDMFGGLNSEVLTNTDLGIAEYTNGNFLSDDTIVSDFALPRRTGLIDFFESEDGKFRRYFEKGSEGELVRHFVAESALYEPVNIELGKPMDEALILTRRVYEDYGEKLLPRAVGYSAGLLDYFFRGKLDVDLVPDPDSSDPTVVRLSGTNGSPDKLDGGTLTLYADDPLTGERRPVSALDSNFTVVADPGQPVESAKFQINAEAERFMAVYKGKLGNEAPQGDFPGGVIGKVLGGVRAESIFFDFESGKYKLRTVDGVFPLPPTAGSLKNIRWGDLDNTFVGTLPATTFTCFPPPPDQLVSFKINRPLGSSEMPPLVDVGDGSKVVSTDLLKALGLPFGLYLGTTVNYSQAVHFKQALVTYDITDNFVFVQTDPDDPNAGFYEFKSRDISVPEPETVVDETVQFSQNFPIVLDQAHQHCGPVTPFPRPYSWRVEEVSLDRQGRLLALVEVFFTQPENNVRFVTLRARNENGQMENRGTIQVNGTFPASSSLWALIDVGQKQVLGVTAESTFSPSSTETRVRFILQAHVKKVRSGGPDPGTFEESWSTVSSFVSPNPDYPTVEATVHLPSSGVQALGLSGLYRADLDPLVATPVAISSSPVEFTGGFLVDEVTKTNRQIRFLSSHSAVTSNTTFISQAKRIRSTSGDSSEVLLLAVRREPEFFLIRGGLLVRWSPQVLQETSLVMPGLLSPAFYTFVGLSFATSGAALLQGEVFVDEELDNSEEFSLFVDTANSKVERFSGQFLSSDYVLLEPKFLYNINDTKFYTVDSSLRPTALPRSLAQAPPVFFPPPAYHLIQLR